MATKRSNNVRFVEFCLDPTSPLQGNVDSLTVMIV